MSTPRDCFPLALVASSLILATLACGSSRSFSEPKAPVGRMDVGDGLTRVDVCQAIPREDIEAVMGGRLVSPPKPFQYYDATGTSGCWYDTGKDSSGEAHYGYVVLTPVAVYSSQPLVRKVTVTGLGQEAYFNNGADARQLWVKMSDQAAFVVAFGDVPREEGARALARLVAAAIR